MSIVQELMARYEGTENHSRLRDAFVVLTTDNGIELENTRRNKAAFEKNFDAFLMSVRGFMLTK